MAKDTVENISKDDTSVIVIDTKSINRHLKELDKIFDAFRPPVCYFSITEQ